MVAEVITESPISISESALVQLQRIRTSYVLGFDLQQEKDQIYEIGGLQILMEKAHTLYLAGMQIDWVEGLDNRGFSFVNPNAKDTCGCGQSFSA